MIICFTILYTCLFSTPFLCIPYNIWNLTQINSNIINIYKYQCLTNDIQYANNNIVQFKIPSRFFSSIYYYFYYYKYNSISMVVSIHSIYLQNKINGLSSLMNFRIRCINKLADPVNIVLSYKLIVRFKMDL